MVSFLALRHTDHTLASVKDTNEIPAQRVVKILRQSRPRYHHPTTQHVFAEKLDYSFYKINIYNSDY